MDAADDLPLRRRARDCRSRPATAILISAGGALGAALPAAAAAFGTYELGAVTVAGLVGIPADEALQVALLSHVLGVVTILAMGVVGIVIASLDAGRPATAAREPVDPAPDPGPTTGCR